MQIGKSSQANQLVAQHSLQTMSNEGEKRLPKVAQATDIRYPGMYGKLAHGPVLQPDRAYASLDTTLTPFATTFLQCIVDAEDVMLGRGGEANFHRFVSIA